MWNKCIYSSHKQLKFTQTQLQNIAKQPKIIETKYRLFKSPQQFELENLYFIPNNICIGRYLLENNNKYGGPEGFSIGVWWNNQSFGVYRNHDISGNLCSYRFDLLKDIKIYIDEQPKIDFTDLIIDVIIKSKDKNQFDIIIEDIDEYNQLKQKNKLSSQDVIKIEQFLSSIHNNCSNMIQLVDNSIAFH
jgi:hypothetical protein